MAIKSAFEMMIPQLLKGMGLDPEAVLNTLKTAGETVAGAKSQLDRIEANQIRIITLLTAYAPELATRALEDKTNAERS